MAPFTSRYVHTVCDQTEHAQTLRLQSTPVLYQDKLSSSCSICHLCYRHQRTGEAISGGSDAANKLTLERAGCLETQLGWAGSGSLRSAATQQYLYCTKVMQSITNTTSSKSARQLMVTTIERVHSMYGIHYSCAGYSHVGSTLPKIVPYNTLHRATTAKIVTSVLVWHHSKLLIWSCTY